MTDSLVAQDASITLTIEITRAATGKTETVDIVCTPINEVKEQENVGNTQHSVP